MLKRIKDLNKFFVLGLSILSVVLIFVFFNSVGLLFLTNIFSGLHFWLNYYQIILIICTFLIIVGFLFSSKPLHGLCFSIILIALLQFFYHQYISGFQKPILMEKIFFSQFAIFLMSILIGFATFFYWLGVFSKLKFLTQLGSIFSWFAVIFGFTGIFWRWYESHLIAKDFGHIPLSNLYEVCILFCLVSLVIVLYYEQLYITQVISAFALLLIALLVIFFTWYSFIHDANQIQPLSPALQSFWMKIHVPTNFIGYGSFSLSAMSALGYLLRHYGLWLDRLPTFVTLDTLMYRTVKIGFIFFTLGTITGAFWADSAWGAYWSWDPKETWAFVVWLNYAAWLHMRLVKGLLPVIAAWWLIVGLFLTGFAFLGVNLLLSGMHSYGGL